VLLWIFWAERSMPGSFAALYVPPGVAAVVAGGLVLYGVATSRDWFAGASPADAGRTAATHDG